MVGATEVDVHVASDVENIPEIALIKRWMINALRATDVMDDVEVSVRVVDEIEMRALNSQYRGQDKATNVLSFAADQHGLPPEMHQFLGDVVICAPIVNSEAAEQGKPAPDHWAHLVLHGTLHLLGYDHESDADAGVMESLEKKILAAQGVADPYAIHNDD